VEQKRAIYRADIRNWSAKNPVDQSFIAHGLLCTFSTPLIFGGRCTGTLNAAASKVDGIEPTTRRVMELVAPRLAYALEMGRARDALAESEARFRDVFETVGDGIVVVDTLDRRLLMGNSAMGAMLGRSPTDLVGLAIKDMHPQDRLEAIIAGFEAAVRSGFDHAMEVPMLRADGAVFLADVTIRSTTIANRRCMVGVFRDATARRRREDEQLHIQKLESIRTLAAGIAHDFNNLLTALIGNVSLAQMSLDASHEAWGLLGEAQGAAVRATALTRQLLTFAKGGVPVRRRINITHVLREAANLAISGTNVKCQFDLPADGFSVMGDEGQLAQVFQNLVRNAVDAMPGGGVVQVQASQQTGSDGDEVCIEVSDHGPGIAPEMLDQIFLPFFTTKDQGNGLGLAVVYSIIQNHAGRIQVSSTLGVGTTFRVRLPGVGRRKNTAEVPLAKHQGSGRVLLMDDEAVVLRVAERTLVDDGYAVAKATNGSEAVAIYGQAFTEGRRFDAVILDLTVRGGMGGREAAEKILAIDPSARLVVSSGYSADAVMANYRRHGFSAVLPKPYTAQDLCQTVQKLVVGR
jgi:PAS domain S-box-containing protein